jgi:RNA polymerase sigma factor (sigma-70 family)
MANPGLGNVLRQVRWLFRPVEPDPASDRQLLERFAASRDEAAFAELVHRHGPMVMGICQRVLPDPNDAHDGFQAAFLVLVRKAGSAGWHDSIAGWLHRVAFRAALRIKASAQRRRTHETQAANMAPASAIDPSWNELRGVLDEELDRLPEKYRTPLVLCYIEGKTNEEAARALGWPAGSMSRRLEKGRELLRARLSKRGVALTGAAMLAAITAQAATAAVPLTLADATVKAALGTMPFAAPVVAVADALVKQMFFAKLKLAAAAVLVMGLIGAGAGLAVQSTLADRLANAPTDKDPAATLWQPEHRVLKLHHRETAITSVALAPDGRHVAAAGSDHVIRLFSLQADGEIDRYDAATHKGPNPLRIAFTGDAGTLAWSDGHLGQWNIAKRSADMHKGLGGLTALAFTPDGKRLAYAGQKNTVTVQFGHADQVQFHSVAAVGSLAFSPDGQFLATAESDSRVRLWESPTGKLLQTIDANQCTMSGAQSVAFSPDGKLATAGMHDGAVRFWDPRTGKELGRLGGDLLEMIRSIDCSPDGRYLAAADGQGIRLYDRNTGKMIRLLEADLSPRCPVVFSPDSKLLAAGGQGTIHLWNLERR